jgi:hypothetical protein
VCRVQLLGSPGDIKFAQQTDGLRVTLPAAAASKEAAYVFRIATRCPAASSFLIAKTSFHYAVQTPTTRR